jgi:arylsulfatase
VVDERPNLLLILTDQQRGDCLGIEGHPVLSTPNLDQLGREGAHFRRAYSECPSCVPARRTLMTGQAPAAQGMVGYKDGVPWDPPHTLAGELARAGYQTEMVGKLHLWPKRKRYGFDHLRLADSGDRDADNDYADWLRQVLRVEGGAVPVEVGMAHGVSANGWVGRPSHLPETQSHSYWCVTQALDCLERRDPTAPFFLNVSFFHPHPPLTPPQLYYDRYIALDLPEPVVGDWAPRFDGPQRGLDVNASRVCLDRETMRRCRAAYYGLINHVDDQIGRLVNYLRTRRLWENTLVLFTSDHGEMLGDHHLFRKTFPYEGSARVPMLLRAPRRLAERLGLRQGVASDAPAGLQDVLPTLLDAAGVPLPEGVTGRSLLDLLRTPAAAPVPRRGPVAVPAPRTSGGTGNPGREPWRDVLHGEHAGCYRYDDGTHYLVDGRTKYVWFSQTGQEQLFDLATDPAELHDLARMAGPGTEARLAPWRRRLIAALRGRPEGFTNGERLLAGRPHVELVPAAAASA